MGDTLEFLVFLLNLTFFETIIAVCRQFLLSVFFEPSCRSFFLAIVFSKKSLSTPQLNDNLAFFLRFMYSIRIANATVAIGSGLVVPWTASRWSPLRISFRVSGGIFWADAAIFVTRWSISCNNSVFYGKMGWCRKDIWYGDCIWPQLKSVKADRGWTQVSPKEWFPPQNMKSPKYKHPRVVILKLEAWNVF